MTYLRNPPAVDSMSVNSFFRLKGRYTQSYQQQELYCDQINAANAELKRYFQGNTHITYWSCKWVKFSRQAVMHDDGVHLNPSVGIFKYCKAIQSAIVHRLNRL